MINHPLTSPNQHAKAKEWKIFHVLLREVCHGAVEVKAIS